MEFPWEQCQIKRSREFKPKYVFQIYTFEITSISPRGKHVISHDIK